MTIEEKLQNLIGAQVITICTLQTQLEAAQIELAALKPQLEEVQAELAKFNTEAPAPKVTPIHHTPIHERKP